MATPFLLSLFLRRPGCKSSGLGFPAVQERIWQSCGRALFSSLPKRALARGDVLDSNGKARKKLGPKGVLDRLRVACERLHELSMPPELRGRQDLVRTDTDLMNVVEQRILQSQRESEFDNLPGKGRPLEFTGNPHADPETDLAYRILAKNGFAPEWVELNKDIRFQVLRWRAALRVAWIRHMEQDGMREFEHEHGWTTLLNQFEEEMQNINRKVLRYNLIVPFGRQIFGYKLEKELQRLQEEIRETKAISATAAKMAPFRDMMATAGQRLQYYLENHKSSKVKANDKGTPDPEKVAEEHISGPHSGS